MHRLSHIRMSLGTRLAIAAALLSLASALGLASGSTPAPAAAAAQARPNFVVIQTDDQTLDGLYAAYRRHPGAPALRAMPNTLDLIAKRGMTFTRYYVSYPLCCPSRVTLLTGRYAHNHDVRGNVQPNGGYSGFASRAAFRHNLATWLQGAGYRTIHVGKFLNGYGDEPYDPGTVVPPGWSAWHTVLNADSDHYFYGYRLNNDGRIEGPYGDSGNPETREYETRDDPGCPFAPANGQPCYYETDTLTNFATQELEATPASSPFYLQLDYTAPHGDFRHPAGPEPAPRHYNWFDGAALPHNRSEGLNESDVGDKPSFIREAPPLTPTELHTYRVYYDKQLESLRSIDDGVKLIVQKLRAMDRLGDTYIIFTSDNGFFFGEHRLLGGKFLAYEPATHLPFLIRGPGIKPRSSSEELVGNIDIAPTILQLAGAKADRSIDGRSMVPFLRDPSRRTRRPLLFESFVQTYDVEANGSAAASGEGDGGSPGGNGSTGQPRMRVRARPPHAQTSISAPPKDYEGIRIGPYKYIAWPNGEKELYDIDTDPNELRNLVRTPNFFPIRNFMERELRQREDCAGRECREPAPPLPLTRRQFRREQAKHKHEHRH